MINLLSWITITVIALVVIALAGYLIAIAWSLLQARRDVARLADGLEAVASHTEPLAERTASIDGAMRQVERDFAVVDDHLEGVARIFGR